MRSKLAALFGMAALCICATAQPRKHKQEPPDEVYYANAYADHYHVPRFLVHAIITQESGWNCRLVSNKGAMGCMQLMPKTAKKYGVRNPFSISENMSGGVKYLAELIQEFGDLRLVAAAYYAGSHRLELRGLNYSNADVTSYVRSVRRIYDEDAVRHQQQEKITAGGQ
jgi:soluble lytic murein transglycosylase-like protein